MCRPLEDVPSGYASVAPARPLGAASWPMMSSATLRRSESRWPHSTSRSSARRWPASSSVERVDLGIDRQAADQGALERDRVRHARGQRGARVGQRAQRAEPAGEAPDAGPSGSISARSASRTSVSASPGIARSHAIS